MIFVFCRAVLYSLIDRLVQLVDRFLFNLVGGHILAISPDFQ